MENLLLSVLTGYGLLSTAFWEGSGIPGPKFANLSSPLAADPAPQLLSPAKALPHRQRVQLVLHRGTKAHQLVAMPYRRRQSRALHGVKGLR